MSSRERGIGPNAVLMGTVGLATVVYDETVSYLTESAGASAPGADPCPATNIRHDAPTRTAELRCGWRTSGAGRDLPRCYGPSMGSRKSRDASDGGPRAGSDDGPRAEPDGVPRGERIGETAVVDAAPPDEPGHSLAAIVGAAAGPVRSVARPIGRRVSRLAAGAQRSYQDSAGARVRRVRRMGHAPLPNLYDVHPEAHRVSQRELGLRTIPVASIRGTAVEGPDQRGGDFLPIKLLRGADWQARWRRILDALDSLVALPPVDLVKWGDEYWVMDGHNRVAAALYNGQVAVDANVTELRVPGVASEPARPMAAYLQGSLDLRAAGEGRLTRTAVRPDEWEILPDAVAGGRGGADPGDEHPDAESDRQPANHPTGQRTDAAHP